MFHHRDFRGLLVCYTRDFSASTDTKVKTFAILSGLALFYRYFLSLLD
jgi:hypothetical protein